MGVGKQKKPFGMGVIGQEVTVREFRIVYSGYTEAKWVLGEGGVQCN